MKDQTTLSDEELVIACDEWISKLAKTGGSAWSLSIPVNFNRDPDMLFCELAKRVMRYKKEVWLSVSERPLTNNDGEVLAYHPDWVHPDFNPKGIRAGFVNGEGGFYSAMWVDYQDCYVENDEHFPTHYLIPSPPLLINN